VDLGVAAAVSLRSRLCSYWFVVLGGVAALYNSVPVWDLLEREPFE
jgi:hypothetical protein